VPVTAEHQKRVTRDKRVLEKQQRQLLKLPSKAQRSEVEALQAALDRHVEEARGKDARHKLTVERLRRQNQEGAERQVELRDEVGPY